MATSSTHIAFLAAKDAETGLAGLISLIEAGERVECASAELAFLLRNVMNDISGCRDELENYKAEAEKLGRRQR